MPGACQPRRHRRDAAHGRAFGGKESQGNLPALLAALAAHRTGRPAKTVYDRDDDFMLTGKRHDFRIDYRCRASTPRAGSRPCCSNRRFAAACPGTCPRRLRHAPCAMPTTPTISRMRVVSHRCRTNTQSNTAFRGFGGPQGMIGIERVIDQVAHHLGLDPLVVRQRNFYAHKFAAAAAKGGRPARPSRTVLRTSSRSLRTAPITPRGGGDRRLQPDGGMIRRGIALTPVKFGISFNTFLNQAGALVHV